MNDTSIHEYTYENATVIYKTKTARFLGLLTEKEKIKEIIDQQ